MIGQSVCLRHRPATGKGVVVAYRRGRYKIKLADEKTVWSERGGFIPQDPPR